MLDLPISYYLTNGTEVFVDPVNNGEKYVFTLTTPDGNESSFVWTPAKEESENSNEMNDDIIEINKDWKEALDIFLKNNV
jgi:1,4-alpha-glucan branching enzyme